MGGDRQGQGWNTGAVACVIVAIAVIGGLGVRSGSAAPARPTSFELKHGRILSVLGNYVGSASLAKRVRKTDSYGNPYFMDVEVGTASIEMTVSEQRGRRFRNQSMKIGPGGSYGPDPDPYGSYGGYGGDDIPVPLGDDEDSLKAGKKAWGRLSFRRMHVGHGQYAHTEEFFNWNSTTGLEKKTIVKLTGAARIGYTTDSAPYGEFNFDDNSTTLTNGVTKEFAPPRTSALIRGFRLANGQGVLHGEITWTSPKKGTVTFSKPSNLAGRTGTIRKVGREFQVTGPKGYSTRLVIRADGSGSVNLGLGRFSVAKADYGGFQLTFE